MKIWAHRGCSQRYPENTLLAFEKAIAIKNLTGIELDIQLTKDGHMVVIHDERVDRTTESIGFVRDYTLSELRKLHIYADSHPTQQIPTNRRSAGSDRAKNAGRNAAEYRAEKQHLYISGHGR